VKIHLVREDIGPMGPARTYCGRVDHGELCVEYDPRDVTCDQCRRAMVRDWCATCGMLLVAWDEEDVCACDAQEVA
jgi:hypothetical protein